MRETFHTTVTLDASGYRDDRTQPYSITPPVPGAVIDDSTVQVIPHVERGNAEVQDEVIGEFSVNFTLWAQAAGGFPIGHHSGRITVDVTFQYFDNEPLMSSDDLQQRWSKKKEEVGAPAS